MRRRDLTLIALVCVVLAAGLTGTNATLVGKPRMADRLLMHNQVLANQAYAPYETDSFLVAHLIQWLSELTGVSLGGLFNRTWGLAYLFALGGCAYWFWALFRAPGRVVVGLLSVALYAGLMLQFSFHHTQDPFAAGLFALCLGLMVQGKLPALLLASLAAGFLWDKHVLLGPVLFAFLAWQGQWRRGLLWAVFVTLAAAVGPAVYRLALGPHDMTPAGYLTAVGGLLHTLPITAGTHLVLLGLPLLGAFAARGKVPPALWCAALVYPAMIVVYLALGLFLFEARSFWIVVPAFAAFTALLVEDTRTERVTSAPVGRSA